MTDLQPSAAPGLRRWLMLVLLFAVVTRASYAIQKSLVLDEFHSYFHATAASLAAFQDGLWQDNHPPLSFLIIGAARDALGSEAWALRTPALLFGLLDIAVVASLAGALVRQASRTTSAACGISGYAPALAAALLAASTLHFDYGTQVRMYALHGLCITVVTYALIALLARDEGGANRIAVTTRLRGPAACYAIASLAAFYNHYFAVQYVALLSVAFVILAWRSRKRAALRAFIAAAAAAFVAALPWALTGLRHQIEHALPPGGDDVSAQAVAESFVQLFFHNIRFGGELGRWAFVAGAALALLVAARGFLLCLRDERLRQGGLLLATAGFALPVVSAGVAAALPRAGFNWHYVLPSSAAIAVLFGVGASGRIAQAAAAISVALASALVGLHLVNPATEDFRGAVAHALSVCQPRSEDEVIRVVSVEWQPALFPQGQPFDYYAPRLAKASGSPAPEREAMREGEFTVAALERLREADRVVMVRRSLPGDQHLLRELLKTHELLERREFGFGTDVRVFGRRSAEAASD
ncbi:MAG: hypothetical protein AAGG01_11110 [Planctomycetota bacterium]